MEEKWIKHYSSGHEILLVGEGDFSFAACLATAFGSASNMVATSLDSPEMLRIKHPSAARNLQLLEEKGCTVIHNVDAHYMCLHHLLSHRKFDRIVFNFPHAGFSIFSEHNDCQISCHRDVVRGFLKNAHEMVKEEGEQKIVIKVPMGSEKAKSKAMKIAVAMEEILFADIVSVQEVKARNQNRSQAPAVPATPCDLSHGGRPFGTSSRFMIWVLLIAL
ncbi:UNVERIFIED_CONTAM: hypothetical protein Sangu_0927900 [Sesamum angustifolium]|uniref:25S rRNA (uridine-N(3))-methyltransferase BMT5-like domain-containing protein n=1 Tax=Sesamum angustifolium TaxID=2727405 RepID=A0AAW2PFB5_9LAMI